LFEKLNDYLRGPSYFVQLLDPNHVELKEILH
jgi:hypothetical protein